LTFPTTNPISVRPKGGHFGRADNQISEELRLIISGHNTRLFAFLTGHKEAAPVGS
jgi:hypothetical protein